MPTCEGRTTVPSLTRNNWRGVPIPPYRVWMPPERSDEEHEKLVSRLEKHPDFRPIYCCNTRIGIYNSRPFTDEAADRLRKIRDAYVGVEIQGDGWFENPHVVEIIVDPASYTTIPEGHRFAFVCPLCRSPFVMSGGVPRRVPRDAA